MKTILITINGKTTFESLLHLPKSIFHSITNGNKKWHGQLHYSNYSITGFYNGLDIVKPMVYFTNSIFAINTDDEELINAIMSCNYENTELSDIDIVSISSPIEDYYNTQIKHHNIIVKTNTPILLSYSKEDKVKKDYSDFITRLNQMTKHKLKRIIEYNPINCGYTISDIDSLSITNNPNSNGITTICPKRVNFKGKTIKGGYGTLLINGNKRILSAILARGLGKSTSSGFGHIKIIA